MSTPAPLLYSDEAGGKNPNHLLFPLHRKGAGIPGHITDEKEYVPGKEGLPKRRLCIHSPRGFQVVEIGEIIYCEARSNYTYFHFTNRPLICAAKSIYEYEALLTDSHFIRIHRSFLVNAEHLKEYIRSHGGYVILSNNHKVEVSRRKKDLLMTRMKQYYKF
jgi:two-component system LytT family response regulator